jgi:quercetin dioxygenase-like cupin family protein
MTQATNLYNWNSLPREFVRDGVERCGFRGENVTCVMNWLSPGMDVRPHSHTFEQVVMIVSGRVRYHVGEQAFDCGPGSMLRVPPHVIHYAEPIGNEVALNLDIFAPMREDYRHLVEYQAAEFVPELAEAK